MAKRKFYTDEIKEDEPIEMNREGLVPESEQIHSEEVREIKRGQKSFNTGIGFWLGIDNDGIPKFSIGNPDGNYLTWDGENIGIKGKILNFLTAIQDYYFDIIHWNSIDGFNTTIDTGGIIEANDSFVEIYTGNVSGRKAYLQSKGLYQGMIETGKLLTIECYLMNLFSITNQTIYIFFEYPDGVPTYENTYHIGWKIVNADLYASNGDETQKITDTGVNLTTGVQHTKLKIELIPGTSAKFYVNGILKVTHTENLPPDEQYGFNIGITTNENNNKQMYLGRILLEKEL